MEKQTLISRLEALDQETLDEMVHDLKSGEASDINNEGPEGQVAFLVRELGLVELARQFDMPLPKLRNYEVRMYLTADALMTWAPTHTVQASSAREAETKAAEWAIENTGNYTWRYEGLNDETVEVEAVAKELGFVVSPTKEGE